MMSVIPKCPILQPHDRVATGLVTVVRRFLLIEIDAKSWRVADMKKAVLKSVFRRVQRVAFGRAQH